MGFDCTLHLVDERLLRDEFVPRLLASSDKGFAPTPFDRREKHAAKQWARARRALRGRDPEKAAHAVCDLAVRFTSCALPFECARGIALSLWTTLYPDVLEHLPIHLTGSPEDVFAEVIAVFPRLRGQFSDSFDGNVCTGIYVPASKVPSLAKWLATQVDTLEAGDQRTLRPLLRVLEVAAAKDYAYWEATDIAVNSTVLLESDLLRPAAGPALAGVTMHDLATPVSHLAGQDDTAIVVSDINTRQTVVFDIGQWPPVEAARFDVYALTASRASNGTWAFVTNRNPPHDPWELQRLPPGSSGLAHVSSTVFDGSRLACAAWIGDRAALFTQESQPGRVAIEQRGTLRLTETLPPRAASDGANGVVRLADGTDLLLYDGHLYEWNADGFRKAAHLDIDVSYLHVTSVPWGRDGLFFLSGRRLYEMHQGQPPIRHLEHVENILTIAAGPPGWLLLRGGVLSRGDIGLCYRPDDGACVPISPGVIPRDYDLHHYDSLHWCAAIESVLARVTCLLWTIPWSMLQAQKRLTFKPPADPWRIPIDSDDPRWRALFVTYRDGVASRLHGQWHHERSYHPDRSLARDVESPERPVVVSFVIAQDGSVGDSAVSESCGDRTWDLLALKTVMMPGLLRPLPDGFAAGVRVSARFGALKAPRRRK